MSLRLEMLQVSRLAPRLLGESTDLVREFVLSQMDGGGFRDRQGRADLYYTVFGLNCLEALQMEVPRPRIAGFLDRFGDGEGLDLVHLACLARAWAAVGTGPGDGVRAAMLECLAGFGDPGTVYDGFLVYGAYQDLGADPPAAAIEALLRSRQADGGGYASTPATTAAVTLYAHLRRPVPAAAVRWLESRLAADGGFTAGPGVAAPDLLSTAVTLHALTAAERSLQPFTEPCLDFIDTLWTNRGAFHGHWADDEVDCEYTFYGLLALGHLSVWSG